MNRRAVALCWTLYGIGVVWRFIYLFYVHPATGYVYSDMEGYVKGALELLNPSYRPDIAATVYPPGAAMLFALLYSLGGSWSGAIAAQLVISSLVPLLIALIGRDLFGRPVALVALAISSVYFPFIDYASYFLAEGPFLFLQLLAMWLLVRSLEARTPPRSLTLAIAGGVALGLAASFKSVALASGLFVALLLAAAALRHRWRKAMPVLLGACAGVALVVAPLAVRATALNEGRFCLIANDGARGVLLGHYGEIRCARFHDDRRNYHHVFGCPVAVQRGYTQDVDLSCGVYESGKVIAAAWGWVKSHPVDALLLSVEHVFELFAGSVPWPTSHTAQRRWAVLFQQLYWVFILLPACLHVVRNFRSMARLDPASLGDVLLLAPLLALMAVAFVSVGEPRYRIPFDGFVILLAARGYAGGEIQSFVPPARPDEGARSR